jgi:CelD/BcsL family acetyltransferase involved in cellulose biosynthesis
LTTFALDSPALEGQGESGGLVRIDLGDPRWSRLVDGNPASLPFHTPAWASFIADAYRFRAFALGVTGADGELAAGLPLIEIGSRFGARRWVALPFTDACGPLVSPSDGADVVDLLARRLEQARIDAGISRIEVRAPLPGDACTHHSAAVLHRLALEPAPDAVARHFRPGVRQGIRSAEKAGVVVRRGESKTDLTDVFYSLHLRTRRRLGVPVQSRRYFRLLWERVLAPGGGFVLIASHEEEPVAAAVFLTGGNTVVYKYGASDERKWRLRPNNGLFWEAIQWACTNGYETFDFGRSDLEAEGLRRFKSSWGATETPLTYSTLGDHRAGGPGHGRLGAIASTTIRWSPAIVCRAAGLFYRWAA